MKGLLVKDLLYIRQNWRIFIHSVFMTVICAVITAFSGKVPEGAGPVATMFIIFIPMMLISDDHRTGYENTLAYSPISKDEIVGARYLLMLAMSLAGCLIVSLILGIGAFIGSAPMGEVLAAAMMFMATALVYPSLCLPLIYYFKRPNAVMGISMLAVGILISASAMLFKKDIDISFGVAAVIFVTALVLTGVSCAISVRIFRKADI